MLWFELSKKDKRHRITLGLPITNPEPASVNTPSAPSAVVGTEVTSPPVSAGLPNIQSTPIRSDPVLPGGRVQLNTDLTASAMSGPVSQNSQIPANWWGYGMPPASSAFNPGLPQVFDAVGKAPIPSAISPMDQVPQYATATTADAAIPSEVSRCLWFKHSIQVHRQAYCRCSRKPLL